MWKSALYSIPWRRFWLGWILLAWEGGYSLSIASLGTRGVRSFQQIRWLKLWVTECSSSWGGVLLCLTVSIPISHELNYPSGLLLVVGLLPMTLMGAREINSFSLQPSKGNFVAFKLSVLAVDRRCCWRAALPLFRAARCAQSCDAEGWGGQRCS